MNLFCFSLFGHSLWCTPYSFIKALRGGFSTVLPVLGPKCFALLTALSLFGTLQKVQAQERPTVATLSPKERFGDAERLQDKKPLRRQLGSYRSVSAPKNAQALREFLALEADHTRTAQSLNAALDSLRFLQSEKRKERTRLLLRLSVLQKVVPSRALLGETAVVTEGVWEGEQGAALPLEGPLLLTSAFGTRRHPVSGKLQGHQGVDFKAYYAPVFALRSGVVTFSGTDKKGGGLTLKLSHGKGLESLYLHLSQVYYKKGERVGQGQHIARSGNSGRSTGPHLHFGIKIDGKAVDPAPFLLEALGVVVPPGQVY